MTVRRVMGIETEYGISVPGHPNANAMLLSSQVVNAYALLTGQSAGSRWNYDEESPLRDARGFDLSRADADPSQLTDEDPQLANMILSNGARLYVDHAHPEYSSPEVLTPRQAVLYDRAGEAVMAAAAERASSLPGAIGELHLYKNNTDNKGASYGTHENYLMSRRTPFAEIVRHLIPFFITRQVYTGAGRVGLGQEGKEDGFQLSQRADYFEVEVGLETTLKRPIVNTRDEPHADPEHHRRLHVIVGDANLSETATLLKMGATSLMLGMIEHSWLTGDWLPRAPVSEMHQVSHDTSLTHRLELADGRRLTAVELQSELAHQARAFVESGIAGGMDADTAEILELWESTLDSLARDPHELRDQLDWVAKLSLLEGYRRRDGIGFEHPRMQLIDLQYADVRPAKGLAKRLEAAGRLRRVTTDTEVAAAIVGPPEETRAYFRGECLRRYPESVAAASWDAVIFEIPGRASLQRVPTLDPLRGTRAHVEALLDASPTAEVLLGRLAQA